VRPDSEAVRGVGGRASEKKMRNAAMVAVGPAAYPTTMLRGRARERSSTPGPGAVWRRPAAGTSS
jgi:hypothetical protein